MGSDRGLISIIVLHVLNGRQEHQASNDYGKDAGYQQCNQHTFS